MLLNLPTPSNLSKLTTSLLTVFMLSACNLQEQTLNNNQPDNQDEITAMTAPRITMGLPITLSSVVDDTNNKSSTINSRASDSDPSGCSTHFDPHSNFMENGYSMSRFLVGLSQQQSCFADFIMASVVAQGSNWINQGVIALPSNPNDSEAPTHVQLEQSGDTNQVWLYFHTHGEALPVDRSQVNMLYLTWTGTENNMTGKFFMVNMPQSADDPDAPEGLRVDFVRTATSATNKIYLDMRDTHSGGMDGFRIDVNRTGNGADAIYTAKGLITFLGQPFPNLPIGIDLPEFSATAIVDAGGLGATSANFNKFAVSLNNDSNQDGVIDPDANEFDLGSYQFNINDTTYFDPALYDSTDTETPFVEQVLEWRNKSTGNAIYIADHQRIQPSVPEVHANYTMFNCIERELCDYNGNGVLDDNSGEWEGWNLGEGYLTNTCIDDATVSNNDCDDFVSKFFESNIFGIVSLNSTTLEPTDDWRNAELTNLTQLTSVHPDDDLTGETTFDAPNPSTM